MIKCLIVDDEAPARELIRLHLSQLENFEVVESLDNALGAFVYLQKHPVDLLFLDIRMPKISGLELLRSLNISEKVIFTTAYREYAADAFELDVVDYLIKPVTQERFLKAITKFMHSRNHRPEARETAHGKNEAFLFFKVGREQVKVLLKDILYIEGLADYIKIHTPDRSYIASEKLSHLEEILPFNSFARIHKSFIVALDKITSFNADQVMLSNKSIPLGRIFKAGFLKTIRAKTMG